MLTQDILFHEVRLQTPWSSSQGIYERWIIILFFSINERVVVHETEKIAQKKYLKYKKNGIYHTENKNLVDLTLNVQILMKNARYNNFFLANPITVF